jgi:uncharacterized protein YdhG (YjbR/CyaY superfamily)
MKKPENVDAYIAGFPKEVQILLQQIRTTIQKAAPNSVEKISYGMPAFYFEGMLAYFAAHTHHIGFYPYSSAIQAFSKDIEKYIHSKGTVQFPIGKPIPVRLVSNMIRFRVNENLEKKSRKKSVQKK